MHNVIIHKDSPHFEAFIALRPNARNLLGAYTIFSNSPEDTSVPEEDVTDVSQLGKDEENEIAYDLSIIVGRLYLLMHGGSLDVIKITQDQARLAQQTPEWIAWVSSQKPSV